MKPYAESCDQNREPILAILKPLFAERKRVLEIGSGTGQHAIYFASRMPHLQWQTSDREENHPGILTWLAEGPANTIPPLALDVRNRPWRTEQFDAIFSANTVHIMGWEAVECMFTGIGETLEDGGIFVLYGPFNYGGQFTSDSNARFDLWLKKRDPASGIRDFEALDSLAVAAGMQRLEDYEMPANNRILVWRKRG